MFAEVKRWRDDGWCGYNNRLPDGTPAQCDPDGDKPCCGGSGSYKKCGNTTEQCSCRYCSDYRTIYKDWRESGGKQKWRYDGRCGDYYPLPDGTPAQCDPDGDKPCCSGTVCRKSSDSNCVCNNCIDFRLVKTVKESGENCTVTRLSGGFLKNACFNENTFKFYFKCTNSDVFYERKFYGVTEMCKNDAYAYQVCGLGFNTEIKNTYALCGSYFCVRSDGLYSEYVPCTGEGCRVKNRNCTSAEHNTETKFCNDRCDYSSTSCEDESNCNGLQYGIRCRIHHYFEEKYSILPSDLCDGYANCRDGEDEDYCEVTKKTVQTCTHYKNKVYANETEVVPIMNYTRCSVFELSKEYPDYPYCHNYLDQTNCSDIERVGGYCKVNGFMSSVSKYVVCYEYDVLAKVPVKICDDNFQNNCVSPSISNCRVHKHKMCDGVKDCSDGSDEIHDMCEIMTLDFNFTCSRAFPPKKEDIGIPVSWIMDNVTDCMNGEDENTTKWKFCPGEIKKLELPDKGCHDVYNCPRGDKSYVEFDLLCDGVESCGDGGENTVCRIARDLPAIKKIASLNGTLRSVCNASISTCEIREFLRPWGDVFGETKIMLHFPNSKVNCSEQFGENYLYLSCMDLCKEANARCPLVMGDRMLEYNSCPGQFQNRSFTLANNSFPTFVDKSESGQYHQNFYQCNNKRCIEYHQVCDLVDDCGDMSDEISCINYMVCENTANTTKHQFISLAQKCDGLYDCFDLSDECNEECGREILGNWLLKIICWIMGVMALLFNLFTVINGMASLKDCETEQMLISKVLMNLIGSGDFLIGLYLVILSIYDSIIFGKEFCKYQAKWLTEIPCLLLGVISTLGSQISLFTMTVLSVIRMYGLTCKPMIIPGPVSKKSVLRVTSLVIAIMTAALAIAVTPLLPSLEDYFVQGMYYDPSYKVFIGFPNKDRHVNILQSYYEKNITGSFTNISNNIPRAMSWKEIGERVDGMFTQDIGNLTRSPVHFYGNDGVCLFKYFVRTNDARRSRQSTDQIRFTGDPVVWTMLAVNLFCFIVITCCYIVITLKTRQSSQRSGQHENEERQKNERAIQNKIMIIITTDFLCWVPFIIISGLHNLGHIDASSWYATFTMTVLPLNSFVNPLVYDKALGILLHRMFERLKAAVGLAITSIRGLWPLQEQEHVNQDTEYRNDNSEHENEHEV